MRMRGALIPADSLRMTLKCIQVYYDRRVHAEVKQWSPDLQQKNHPMSGPPRPGPIGTVGFWSRSF